MPVYLHPREATREVSELMWKGREWLAYSALGYAQRVGMHVLGIVTSGVLDRFGGVKIVLGHMGEHMFVYTDYWPLFGWMDGLLT